MKNRITLLLCATLSGVQFFFAQVENNWQQRADYKMEIDMNVENYRYKGRQTLTYTNNSPEALYKVYYHLYFNAFQPGSQMDMRLQHIMDPDRRMVNEKGNSRIAALEPEGIGFIKVKQLKQNGTPLQFFVQGTILEVTLDTPIAPKEQAVFEMKFLGQVPLQIRRSGRNNKEGVALSMAQWYPKMAAYDDEGWHTDPYIAREFYGVWGDFDVKIRINKNYVVAATGYLQNPKEVGHGYATQGYTLPKLEFIKRKNTWHFKAPNVHDFTWAADKDFAHDILQTPKTTLHFFYKKTMQEKYLKAWKALQPKTAELLQYYSTHIGQYPYKQYSVIQGGDGGMEYAMCTLVTGERSLRSLFGVTAHEMAHTWFQFLLASNESKHAWMDEGFTSYISDLSEDFILGENATNPHKGAYRNYRYIVKQEDMEEPMETHSDHFDTNSAYGIASYSKGCIFLSQLEYIIGKENVAKTLKAYFKKFAFKHPKPNDIKRVAEKVSGIHLEWYLNWWARTTYTIDYTINVQNKNQVVLKRLGRMAMPLEVAVTYQDGSKELFYIPLDLMRGEKNIKATRLKDSTWGNPVYTFRTQKTIAKAEIDPSKKMADVNLENNIFIAKE